MEKPKATIKTQQRYCSINFSEGKATAMAQNRGGFMNTAKKEVQRAFTQFDLTKQTLNNLSQYDLTPVAKLVLLYLTDCYNPNNACVFPKQKTIAIKLGISERSVIRAVQELFKAGLILIECKHTNRYILMPKMTSQQSQIDRLSQLDRQKVIFTPDNLSPTCKEQIKETKKEQTECIKGGNVYSDDAILREYAIKHGAKNINAYVSKLKSTGSAAKILRDNKPRELYPYTLEQTEIERKRVEESRAGRKASETCDKWVEYGKKIGFKK